MDFIIVSTADWDNPFWTNKQHTAKTLSKLGHRVIYIDSLGLRKPTATITDLKRIYNKLKRITGGIRKVDKNIWVIAPFSMPFQENRIIRSLNEYVVINSIKSLMKKNNFTNPILWTYSPLSSFLLNKFGKVLSVYHCVDEISAQPGMPKNIIIEKEKDLLKNTDIVFVTSKNLYKNKIIYNKNTYYFPNVADFRHFNKAYSRKWERPKDIKSNIKKKIGFVGAISSYKMDFQLLDYVAKNNLNCEIYLIGKIGEGEPNTNVRLLKENKNIIFLGPKDYKDLPQYLAFFNVCILPCNKNKYTDNMFPMKFFEYLSAGKPVVTTKLLSILDFEEYCYIANNKEEFADMLKKAIEEDCDEKRERRFLLAKEYTYEERTKKMLEILNKYKERKS